MKNIILTLLIITVLQSCTEKSINNDLLGTWSSTNSSSIIDLQFFRDSLVQNAWERITKFSWKSDSSIIYYTQLTNIDPDLETDFILEYKFNTQKDTLYVKTETDSSFTIQFLKINNAYQYLGKNINLDIDLPKKQNELIPSGNKGFDFNIYVGYRNRALIIKTDRLDYTYNFIGDSFKIEVGGFIMSVNEEDIKELKYMLFADKKVPEKEVDSIKNILKKTRIKKIFRVYTNNKVDYKKNDWKAELDWFGIYE